MKSRQVGFVLAALIAIGIAGLIIRFVSVDPEEEILSGLLPMAGNVVTRITLHDSATDKGADLVRIGEFWTINNRPVFPPKMDQFWLAVSAIDGAQLIAENPDNHERMGVADGQGTVVSFYLDDTWETTLNTETTCFTSDTANNVDNIWREPLKQFDDVDGYLDMILPRPCATSLSANTQASRSFVTCLATSHGMRQWALLLLTWGAVKPSM